MWQECSLASGSTINGSLDIHVGLVEPVLLLASVPQPLPGLPSGLSGLFFQGRRSCHLSCTLVLNIIFAYFELGLLPWGLFFPLWVTCTYDLTHYGVTS